jgi:hypothetical protein
VDAEIEQEKAVPTRHGSENRQRNHSVRVRLDDAENALLGVKAGEAGLSHAAYMRACALGDAGPRAQRTPPTDRKEVAQLHADLARIGNNLNQLTRAVNQNQIPDILGLEEAAKLVCQAGARCMKALGYASHDS